jgi:hypothetical protein
LSDEREVGIFAAPEVIAIAAVGRRLAAPTTADPIMNSRRLRFFILSSVSVCVNAAGFDRSCFFSFLIIRTLIIQSVRSGKGRLSLSVQEVAVSSLVLAQFLVAVACL